MEVDSMHSAIENKKKFIPVYSMIDCRNIMSQARSARNRKNAKPYIVRELTCDEILDLKDLEQKLIKNRCIDDDGNTVQQLKIKCLRYEKDSPGIIKFRYDHTGPYKILNVNPANASLKENNTIESSSSSKELVLQEIIARKGDMKMWQVMNRRVFWR